MAALLFFLMNTLIQTLDERSGLFGLNTRVLCDKHMQLADPSNFLSHHSSPDECEQCVKDFFEAEKEYRLNQEWLGIMARAHSPVEPYNVTVYISGPMTGQPEFNHPAFHRVNRMLIHYGYRTVNPATLPTDKPYAWLIRQGINGMLRAQYVVMLKGWRSSSGARLERSIAKLLGLPIYLEII